MSLDTKIRLIEIGLMAIALFLPLLINDAYEAIRRKYGSCK